MKFCRIKWKKRNKLAVNKIHEILCNSNAKSTKEKIKPTITHEISIISHDIIYWPVQTCLLHYNEQLVFIRVSLSLALYSFVRSLLCIFNCTFLNDWISITNFMDHWISVTPSQFNSILTWCSVKQYAVVLWLHLVLLHMLFFSQLPFTCQRTAFPL